ncbi:MAG: hypothetical protein QOF51_3658 [Chloroflexota bacterium]|jgi:sporulation protein YlmC with PRC-barrel domain|nr:hypothetical protein [Chloroflexota bacterium]
MNTAERSEEIKDVALRDRPNRRVRRLTALRGMPVVELSSAHRIGRVGNVFIDGNTGRLSSIEVSPSHRFKEGRIPASKVRRIGEHSIMVLGTTQSAESRIAEHMADDGILDVDALLGLEVLAENGDLVGHLAEAYLDPETLEVTTYELGRHPLARWIPSKGIMPRQVVRCSHDLMLVPADRRAAALAPAHASAPTQLWREPQLVIAGDNALGLMNGEPAERSA